MHGAQCAADSVPPEAVQINSLPQAAAHIIAVSSASTITTGLPGFFGIK